MSKTAVVPALGRAVPTFVTDGNLLPGTNSVWQRGPELLGVLQLLLHIRYLGKREKREDTYIQLSVTDLESNLKATWGQTQVMAGFIEKQC